MISIVFFLSFITLSDLFGFWYYATTNWDRRRHVDIYVIANLSINKYLDCGWS